MQTTEKKYDKWQPSDDIRLKKTVDFIGDASGRILDVGMKHGFTLEALSGIQKVGTDINRAYLENAAGRGKIRDIVLCDVFALPFKENAFNTVLLTEVFEHIENPENAIAEISRVARGKLIISTPNNCWARKAKHFLLGKPHLISQDHVKEYPWKEVKDIVESYGFKMTRFRGLGFFFTYRPYPFWEFFGRIFPTLSADMLMEYEKRLK